MITAFFDGGYRGRSRPRRLSAHVDDVGSLVDHLPGVDLYRRPADATFLINIALAFSSGYLVHRYATEGMPSWSKAA